MLALVWGYSKASWAFQKNKKSKKQVWGAERHTQVNTREKRGVQFKARARARACMEGIQKYQLAWLGVTGREGKT